MFVESNHKLYQPSHAFIQAFLARLVLLEKNTGFGVKYHLMKPLSYSIHDDNGIQNLAKQIATSIGLDNFRFTINTVKLDEKTAGQIDLAVSGNEVPIEIDCDLLPFPNTIAAVLCHEICHKWLQYHGIRLPIQSENEILTDITTIYLGFGKTMLNGCKSQQTSRSYSIAGTQEITNTLSAGYLKRDQLALVYMFVCAMRKIKADVYMHELNPDAVLAIKECNASFEQYYATCFHEDGTMQFAIKIFNEQLFETQNILCNLDKYLTFIKTSYISTIEYFIAAQHKKLESFRHKVIPMGLDQEPDPCLRFLYAIQRNIEIERYHDEAQSMLEKTKEFLDPAITFSRLITESKNNFATPSSTMFTIITCPIDGTQLRLPENSGNLIVTCPACKYRFAFNTNIISFPTPLPTIRLSWWENIKYYLRKRRRILNVWKGEIMRYGDKHENKTIPVKQEDVSQRKAGLILKASC